MSPANPSNARRDTRSVFERALQQPQKLWLRRALFQVHLWTGILLGLYIIAIGVSGSILVFRDELLPKPRVNVGHVDYNACTPDRMMAAVNKANAAYPSMRAFLAACPSEANKFYTVSMRTVGKRPARGEEGSRQRSVYVHPNTGEVMGDADTRASWVNTVVELHVDLLLRRSGRTWNGIGACVLLLLSLSGIVLWWPGVRTWAQALRVNFRRGWRKATFDLHSAIGIWTVVFTLTWALTGMYFAWPKAMSAPVNWISKPVTANYPAAQLRAATAAIPAADRKPGPPDAAGMLRNAQLQSPGGHLEGFFYGAGPKAVFTVYMARGRQGDFSNTDFVYFDQGSGRHLYTWHRGQNQSVGDWLMWLIAPLHFGTSWGQGVKVLWALLGLSLPALTITGFLMYWNRWLRKRWPLRRRTA